jgi:hypothetical protein
MRTILFSAMVGSLIVLYACAASQSNEPARPAPTAKAAPAPSASRSVSDTDMKILKEKLKADKKLIVAENMGLSDSEAKQFWPLFDSYQKELEQVNQRLGKTITEYADAYNNGRFSNETAKHLMGEVLDIEEDEVNLKRSYSEKLGEVLPANKVARYYQIENKIRALVKGALAAEIPLVP